MIQQVTFVWDWKCFSKRFKCFRANWRHSWRCSSYASTTVFVLADYVKPANCEIINYKIIKFKSSQLWIQLPTQLKLIKSQTYV